MSTKAARTRAADFRRLLEQCGIRVTDQRLALLKELSSVHVPISHPELTLRMAQSSPACDRG
jgi:Fur family transcriptional regulator, ferric uptake regulator